MPKLRTTILALCAMGCIIPLGFALSLHAESTASAALCADSVERGLAAEERMFRTVLFGSSRAADALPGEVRFDREGNAWIKSAANAWRTMIAGRETETRTDNAMEQAREFPPRSGLFQTHGVLTSDLVPSLSQSFRALQCRTSILCRTAELSVYEEGEDLMTIDVPGCIREQRLPLPTCQIVAAGGNRIDAGDILSHCRGLRQSLLDHEENILLTATENDASERSLLQLQGNFDAFLLSIRSPITGTLRSVAGLLGSLSKIPCFSGSCEPAPLP